jgi:hypothetical protein
MPALINLSILWFGTKNMEKIQKANNKIIAIFLLPTNVKGVARQTNFAKKIL